MISRLLFLTFVILTFSNCGLISSFKIRDAFLEEYVGLNNFKEEIPFRQVNGMIIVTLEIEGVKEDFIFDTAASTKVSHALAQKLKHSKLGYKKTIDSNNQKRKIKYVKIDELKIGTVPFHAVVSSVSDLDKLNKLACVNLSGILGVNIMNKGVWQIDFQRHKIIFTDDVGNLNMQGDESKVNFYSVGKGVPMIDLRSKEDYLGELALDTGYNGGVLAIAHNSIANFESIERTSYTSGIFSSEEYTQKIIRLPSLKMGNSFALSNPLVTISEKGFSYGLLGTLFLKDYITTIDWKNQEILLKRVHKEIDDSIYGFGFHGRISDGIILVSSIYPKSEAYQLGIRLNDQILQIDDIVFKEDVYAKYCNLSAYLNNEERKSVSVLIKKEDGVVTLELKKNDLAISL